MIGVLLCLYVSPSPNYLVINLTFTYYFHFMERKESFRKVLSQRGRFKTFAPSITLKVPSKEGTYFTEPNSFFVKESLTAKETASSSCDPLYNNNAQIST